MRIYRTLSCLLVILIFCQAGEVRGQPAKPRPFDGAGGTGSHTRPSRVDEIFGIESAYLGGCGGYDNDGANGTNAAGHQSWAQERPENTVIAGLLEKYDQQFIFQSRKGVEAARAFYAEASARLARYGIDLGDPGSNGKEAPPHLYWARKQSLEKLRSCIREKVGSLMWGAVRGEAPRVTPAPVPPTRTEPTERRVALVIGNSAYQDIGVLANPVNDARAITAALETARFTVEKLENGSYRAIHEALDRFGKSIQGGAVGLFYFSGHGIQINGVNYLIPIGATIRSESEVKYEAVNADRVTAKMADAGNPLNIVVLDACRNNPFARSLRSAARGLAMMDAPSGVLIAYATAPGDTAEDNPDGRNGLYTKYFLQHMTRPGLKIEEMLKAVRYDVSRESKASGHQQVPWELSSLIGDFCFTPPARGEVPSH
jgi:hypothetical protein